MGDFGLATEFIVQQHEEPEPVYSSLGKHTAEVGTTLYMSPEQVSMKLALVIHCSHVHVLIDDCL